METRKITVVSTKNQRKSVINSAAVTLGQLKSDLNAAGIDYSGMTFYEGTAKVELKTDESVLPSNVPYKGQVTNELVIMLTNTNKKIRSGADLSRTEAYAKIKELGLQSACIAAYGKNFTMCKTTELNNLIASASTSSTTTKVEKKPKEAAKETSTLTGNKGQAKTEAPKAKVEAKAPEAPVDAAPVEVVDTKARKAMKALVESLYGEDTIDENTYDEVIAILEEETEDDIKSESVAKSSNTSSSPYSDDEISEMFACIN